MKVHFTTAAVEHLDGIYAYIAADSVKYAQQVIDRIIEKANNVAGIEVANSPADMSEAVARAIAKCT